MDRGTRNECLHEFRCVGRIAVTHHNSLKGKVMIIRFSCPSCGGSIEVSENYAGKKGKCPKCNTSIIVPSVSGGVAELAHSHPASATPEATPPTGTASRKPWQGKPLAEIIRSVGLVRGTLILGGVLIVLILIAFCLERGFSSGLEEAKLSRLEQRIAGLEKTAADLSDLENRIRTELQSFKKETRDNQLQLATNYDEVLKTFQRKIAILYSNQLKMATTFDSVLSTMNVNQAETENIKGLWEYLKEMERQSGETSREMDKQMGETTRELFKH